MSHSTFYLNNLKQNINKRIFFIYLFFGRVSYKKKSGGRTSQVDIRRKCFIWLKKGPERFTRKLCREVRLASRKPDLCRRLERHPDRLKVTVCVRPMLFHRENTPGLDCGAVTNLKLNGQPGVLQRVNYELFHRLSFNWEMGATAVSHPVISQLE